MLHPVWLFSVVKVSCARNQNPLPVLGAWDKKTECLDAGSARFSLPRLAGGQIFIKGYCKLDIIPAAPNRQSYRIPRPVFPQGEF